jgi:hypothetical protein
VVYRSRTSQLDFSVNIYMVGSPRFKLSAPLCYDLLSVVKPFLFFKFLKQSVVWISF